MPPDLINHNKLTLAIHSTDNSFCFAYRENNKDLSDNFFTKKFEKDLCNNLIVDFTNFITKENLKRIDKISVSIGPSNFNASRQIIVLARTLAQQIDCSLYSFSSFELMAKRIAMKNNIYTKRNSFWIFKELKRRGYIAGKYEICISDNPKKNITIKKENIYILLLLILGIFISKSHDDFGYYHLPNALHFSENKLELINFEVGLA